MVAPEIGKKHYISAAQGLGNGTGGDDREPAPESENLFTSTPRKLAKKPKAPLKHGCLRKRRPFGSGAEGVLLKSTEVLIRAFGNLFYLPFFQTGLKG